jgi:glycosyltransferase involved in cell wall biosynthesis
MPDDPGPLIFVAPNLEPGAVQVALSLWEHRLLRRMVTTLAVPGSPLLGCLPQKVRRALATRTLPPELTGSVQFYPLRECVRVLAGWAGAGEARRDRAWYWAETGFDRDVARRWSGRVPVIYGCEHASLETFLRQKRRGGRTVLWQVIAHPRCLDKVLTEEFDRFPATVTPYMRLLLRNAPRMAERKERQHAAADLVVANSPFVRRTFIEAGFPAGRIVTVPTGCPPVPPEAADGPAPGGVRTFLNAGTLSVRKGAHLLLEAWRRLQVRAGAELVLAGDLQLPEALRRDLPPGARLLPRLPRPDLHAQFRRSEAFLLPTLAEGRANVVLEALSNGLPVVTTPNSGCEDLVQDGRTGFLIPARDVEALAGRLQWCLDHPADLRAMREACLGAARRWQAHDFRRAHAARIRDFLGCPGRSPSA